MSVDPVLPTRMVHVRTVASPFHARVIAARLGAEGILTELRGNLGEGPYPFGAASVWVAEADAEAATELLLADEVESAFEDGEADEAPGARRILGWTPRRLAAAGGLVLIVVGALAAHLGL
jgi:hypothetical protein